MNAFLHNRELIIDSFAGGGGASLGIERALGVHVDVAINHDPEAVCMHAANHPQTLHFSQHIYSVDPLDAAKGRPVGLFWASPDCKHFSKAKGGKPVEKHIRDLAWTVVHWAKRLRGAGLGPRVIALENVEEFQDWGPLTDEGRPCPASRGLEFRRWVKALEKLGYRVEWRELRACDYGAPTIRKRLFVIARCDRQPIVWPEPTHGPDRALPYRVAAECIDWSIPVRSIFERERPLAPATCRRIARGIYRYVIDCPKPFVVPYYGEAQGQAPRSHDLEEPLPTVTPGGRFGLVAPQVIPVTHHGDDRCQPIDEPLRTVTGAQRGEFALSVPYLMKLSQNSIGHGLAEPFHTVMAGATRFALLTPLVVGPFLAGCGGRAGQSRERGAAEPTATGTSKADTCLVTPYFVPRYGERPGQEPRCQPPDEPLSTVVPTQNGASLCAAWLAQHNTRATGHAAEEPLSTVCSTGSHQQLAVGCLTHFRNNCDGRSCEEPLNTITSGGQRGGIHFAEVRAFLQTYYGSDQDTRLEDPLPTATTRDRFGLVTVAGVEYQIVDIGMRMLAPRELFRAQGFGDDYKIDPIFNGKPLTKTAQVRMCGNSVCPPLAEAIVRANVVLREVAAPAPAVLGDLFAEVGA